MGCVARKRSPLRADKRYLEILELAAKEGESRVDQVLGCLLEMGEAGEDKLNAKSAMALLLAGEVPAAAASIEIAEVSLAGFDELLCGAGVLQ